MRVLIVDDHPIVLAGLRALLSVDREIEVRDAADGDRGSKVYLAWRPDVAIVDLHLPGLSGLDFCRRICSQDPNARIVIFTLNDESEFAARAIEAGAKGYIAKNDDPAQFVEAVRNVARGGVHLHPDMAREMRSDVSKVAALTAREWEIVRMLAAGRSMGDIADALHVSYKTVINNCTALKQKLGARSSMDLMRLAIATAGS